MGFQPAQFLESNFENSFLAFLNLFKLHSRGFCFLFQCFITSVLSTEYQF